VAGILAPFVANSAGWIFTEMGRQPFVVAPNPTGVDGVFMFTAAAVSPGVSFGEILFSVSAFTLVYAVLMVFEIRLLVRYVRGGVVSAVPELAAPSDDDDHSKDGDVLAFAY
jgi:cytochrome d ubiquinol oxidase subunit I